MFYSLVVWKYLLLRMKHYLIILFFFCGLFNRVYGQSASAAIDSLIKFRVITTQERPAMERELKYIRDKGHANYRVAILGGLENILLQKTFHIDPHKTGISYSYSNEHINKKNQDSINTSLRVSLRKIKRANLLTERVYIYTLESIDSGRFVVELQMIGSLTEMSSRLEWLAPNRLLPVAEQLHKNGIVSDSSFLRLKDDINNGKLESAFQLNNYCKHDRIFDMAKYPDDPNVWLEQMHRDIASILPGLDFTDFSYTEIPDTSFSIPWVVRFKVILTCNGRIYKHISLPISNYRNPRGSEFCYAQKNEKTEIIRKLKGKWVSDSDRKYKIVFYKSILIEYYKGEKTHEIFSFRVDTMSCDSSSQQKNSGLKYYLIKTDRNGQRYCYSITLLSEKSLQLIYTHGRILDFTRE